MREEDLHKLIVQWLQCALPEDALLHHSPNEGARKPQYGRKLRALGLHTGWPDLELLIPPSRFHDPCDWAPIFMEIKTPAGRHTPAQIDTQHALRICGAHVEEVRSIDDVQEFLSKLVPLKTQGRAGMLKQLEEAKRGAA